MNERMETQGMKNNDDDGDDGDRGVTGRYVG